MFTKDLPWYRNIEENKRFIENLAPIVLFTYNRLDHTRQTVEALQKNVYAQESRLFIYSDAPKNEAAKASVVAVRDYLHSITGFLDVTIIERDENWGLARNIIDGVTEIVNQFGKIIVLEDDIVTAKYFLQYMNDALEIYQEEPHVMEISGYMYPIEKKSLPETFFLATGDCWGWATWKDAWEYFERHPEKLIKTFSKEEIYHFNFEGTEDFWQQVEDNASGKLYTWAVFWMASIFQQQGLMLCVRDSLCRNVGMDASGEHCGMETKYDVPLSENAISEFPDHIEEHQLARELWRKFFLCENGFLFKTKHMLKQIIYWLQFNSNISPETHTS